MAKHYRKSHKNRRHSRKRHSRKRSDRKRSDRKRHTHRRSQRGGGNCAALPMNRESFAQRGGMAPYQATGTDYLVDQSTRVQAEVGPLDQAFGELPAVLKAAGVVPNQLGGRRHHRHRKSRKQRGGMAPFNAPYEMYKGGAPLIPPPQRGGSEPAPFSEVSRPSLLPVGSLYGQNPQFVTEAGVNSLYRYEGGAQVA